MKKENTRFLELDGLRGVAALIVFFSHFVGFIKVNPFITNLQHSPFRILWHGEGAVYLFFVLSGLVLSKSLIRKKQPFSSYIVKRIFRIYPAYYFSIFLSIVLIHFYEPNNMKGLSEWAQTFWLNPFNLETIGKHLVLIYNLNTRLLNPVIWTLVVEMKMSLFIPFFIFLMQKIKLKYAELYLLGLSFLLSLIFQFFFFLPHFILGFVLAFNFEKLSSQINFLNKISQVLLISMSVFFFGIRYFVPHSLSIPENIFIYISSLGSFLLIIFCSEIKFLKKFLSSKLFIFLGETSYSFYLLHLPILLFVSSIFYPIFNSLLICGLISLCTTYLLSWIVYIKIEQKFIYVGKLASRKISRKFTKKIMLAK